MNHRYGLCALAGLLGVVSIEALVACGDEESANTGPDAAANGNGGGPDAAAARANDASGTNQTTTDGGTMTNPRTPPTCATLTPPTGTTPTLQVGQWTNISPPGLYRPRGSTPSFGCMDIHALPCSPSTLYLTTDVAGLWKSTDGGSTWKQIGDLPSPVSPGVMQINPENPNEMYLVGGVRGASLGFWVSHDGGDTWAQPNGFTEKANNSVGGWTNDVYEVAVDPTDFKHVLLTFHSGFEFTGDAGVLESKDGGDTWTRHWPRGNGAGHTVWFLNDEKTWLLGTQGNGYWRTSDSGDTWKQVSTVNMQHGGTAAFYTPKNVLYVGALSQILRSTDDGQTFTSVGPQTQDGYYAVASDGTNLFAQAANTGANSTNTPQPYITSPESDGTTWTAYNGQAFSDGPYRMRFDPVNRIMYSANWNDGVWALKVSP